ncbi:type IV toxin-antitoxin system AbiEi family antitoxin domain-containing protein [Puerhibacterium puerhi]|uniref:type IV toxin-antitoxin system AbiEi family antitoxin domain-containing protein n=1 Tax=Puerhibacterium puerhi TaxID=2692623 RepID=UPI001359864D|nr:hypothetical protein [Puerhibacterium puerhi]
MTIRAWPEPLAPPSLPALLTATTNSALDQLATADDSLHRLRPGLYTTSDPDAAPAAARRDLVLARVAATYRTLESDYWFSHQTAALLHGLWTYRLQDRVHVTQLYPPQVRRADDSYEHRFRVTRHWTRLPRRDRTIVAGIPVTTLERTAVDCARSLSPAAALVAMDCALRHGADLRLIGQILEESRGKRGVVQARRIVALAAPGSESPGETLARFLLLEAGLPRPQTQVRVRTALGDRWIDIGWQEARVGVEFDGDVKYADLAQGDPEGVRRRQRERQAAIEDEGWRIERAGWSDVDEPSGYVLSVRRALHGRWGRLTAGPG